jgi:signal transduction histidine kinase
MSTSAPLPLSTVEIASDRDVVHARQLARRLAALLGFGAQDQARIATATSEVCRNAFRYARRGRCEFLLEQGSARALVVRTTDQGPGIPHLDEVLGGRYASPTGLGLGLLGTRRLMDRFEIDASAGTRVTFMKELPRDAPHLRPADIATQLAHAPPDLEEELRNADHDLMRAVGELRARNHELEGIRAELEETNRGVVALYAELDEKAESLRKATELKSRFLSNMSHEFRTPLSSIQSLARLLLDGSEGPLAEGQRHALDLLRRSALDLSEMVDDLLDLAKIEAGKISVRPEAFELAELFGSLRGTLRPLLRESGPVQLCFDAPTPLGLHSDKGRIAQVLRNFVSNALKFTERGEVRVGARQDAPGMITFFVRDTGIGIAPEDQERIFEEFAQVDSAQKSGARGTGLGLPLSRKLAQLLGGEITLESAPGQGSTFFLTLPQRWTEAGQQPGQPVLALHDDAEALARWERFLDGTRYRLVPARTLDEAREALRRERPLVVIAAASIGGAPTRPLLEDLRKAEATREVPLVGIALGEPEARQLALCTDLIVRRLEERLELLEALARARRAAVREGGAHA